MLEIYLTSVIIWMIIIGCTVSIFKDAIKKKIKTDETKKSNLFKKLRGLFVLAAVPIVRLMVIIVIVYIATCKQEDYDKLMKKDDND